MKWCDVAALMNAPKHIIIVKICMMLIGKICDGMIQAVGFDAISTRSLAVAFHAVRNIECVSLCNGAVIASQWIYKSAED